MSARLPSEVFAEASTIIESGGGEKPRIIITFPDIDAAHVATVLLTAFMGRREGVSPAAPQTPPTLEGMAEPRAGLNMLINRLLAAQQDISECSEDDDAEYCHLRSIRDGIRGELDRTLNRLIEQTFPLSATASDIGDGVGDVVRSMRDAGCVAFREIHKQYPWGDLDATDCAVLIYEAMEFARRTTIVSGEKKEDGQ